VKKRKESEESAKSKQVPDTNGLFQVARKERWEGMRRVHTFSVSGREG